MHTVLSYLKSDPINLKDQFEALKINDQKSIESLLEEAEELALQAQESKQHQLECEILTYLGRGYRFIGASFKSISSLNKAYILFNSYIPHLKKPLANIYRELGNTYSNNLQDHLTAIDYLFKGYSLNITELNSIFLNNLGSNYNSLGQYQKARNYLLEGVKIAEKENREGLAFLHHNLAHNMTLAGRPEASFEEYDKCITYCKEAIERSSTNLNYFNIDYIYSFSLHGKSEAYLLLNDLMNAKLFLKEAKEISKMTNQFVPLSSLYLLEGKILLKENKIEDYHKLAKASIDFCSAKNLLNDKHTWLGDLQEVFEKNKDYKNAYLTTKELILNTKELKSQHKEFNISQVLVSKEEEILALQNKNRINQLQKDELQQFAYIVTHDLKTPLSNISNFAGLFNKKYSNSIDEKGVEYLEYITSSAQKLHTMLSDLFQYISIKKEDELSFEKCNIDKLISNLLQKNLIKQSQIELNLNEITEVPIRDFHLSIIIENIINNAKKFKKHNEPLFLKINLSLSEDTYTFKIADNGIGIEDQYKSNIFEIFKRLNKNTSEGTGIGLSVCKKIVQIYLGSIWIEDNDMNGATFCFTIKIPTSTKLGT